MQSHARKGGCSELCPQAGGWRKAGVETRGMRTPAERGSEFRSCLSAHRAILRGTRSKGEEEGAGEVCQIRGAWGSFSFTFDRTPQALWQSGLRGKVACMAKESARMLPIKSSEVSPAPPNPALPAQYPCPPC